MIKKIKEFLYAHPWFLVSIAFTVLFVLTLLPLITLARMPQWDAADLIYPNFTYIIDSFREGRIPFWDPYTKCGYPFHAEPYQPILNPLVYLISLTSIKTDLGFIIYWLSHWWWSGMGMIWLCSLLGILPMGALIAACCFSFSGFFVGNAEHTPFIVTISWLPWFVACADLAMSRNKFGYFLLAGTALAMSALGGYPPLVAFSGLVLGVWLMARFPDQWFRVLQGLMIMGIVVAVVALPSLYAFLTEGVGHTPRVNELDFTKANFGDPFTPMAAFSFIFPFATFMMRGWLGADVSMVDAYCGILAFPFIVFWWKKLGKIKPLWWVVFFSFAFLVSLGGQAGLRSLLFIIFPPMRYIRFSGVFRAYWIFAIALATGFGFSYFVKEFQRHQDQALSLLGKIFKKYYIFVFFVAVLMVIVQIRHHGKFLLFSSFLPAAFILPMICFFLNRKKNIVQIFVVLFIIDMIAHVHINHGSVWDAGTSFPEIESKHQFKTEILGNPGGRKEEKDVVHWSTIQVQKIAHICGYNTMSVNAYESLVHSEYASVLKSPLRFWLSPSFQKRNTDIDTLSVLIKKNVRNPVPVFFEPTAQIQDSSKEDIIPGSFGGLKIVRYSPEYIELEVEISGVNDVALTSTERWAHGWKAFVDGVEVPVYLTNLLFRGLILKSGHHRVEWRYQPSQWKNLAIFSVSFLFFIFVLGLFLVGRKNKNYEH